MVVGFLLRKALSETPQDVIPSFLVKPSRFVLGSLILLRL